MLSMDIPSHKKTKPTTNQTIIIKPVNKPKTKKAMNSMIDFSSTLTKHNDEIQMHAELNIEKITINELPSQRKNPKSVTSQQVNKEDNNNNNNKTNKSDDKTQVCSKKLYQILSFSNSSISRKQKEKQHDKTTTKSNKQRRKRSISTSSSSSSSSPTTSTISSPLSKSKKCLVRKASSTVTSLPVLFEDTSYNDASIGDVPLLFTNATTITNGNNSTTETKQRTNSSGKRRKNHTTKRSSTKNIFPIALIPTKNDLCFEHGATRIDMPPRKPIRSSTD